MSFSGAILSRKGKVKYAEAPCATLMLHGTADALVPYKQIVFFNLGFFGGGKLVERFQKFGYNYKFTDNPSLSERNRKTTGFEFDQNISRNILHPPGP